MIDPAGHPFCLSTAFGDAYLFQVSAEAGFL
jgi:hypothetical protein